MKTSFSWNFKLKNKSSSRLDLSSITPMNLSKMNLSEIIEIEVFDGNILRKVGDFFQVTLIKNKIPSFNLKDKKITLKKFLDEPCLVFYGDQHCLGSSFIANSTESLTSFDSCFWSGGLIVNVLMETQIFL